jgi:hypothetical protein
MKNSGEGRSIATARGWWIIWNNPSESQNSKLHIGGYTPWWEDLDDLSGKLKDNWNHSAFSFDNCCVLSRGKLRTLCAGYYGKHVQLFPPFRRDITYISVSCNSLENQSSFKGPSWKLYQVLFLLISVMQVPPLQMDNWNELQSFLTILSFSLRPRIAGGFMRSCGATRRPTLDVSTLIQGQSILVTAVLILQSILLGPAKNESSARQKFAFLGIPLCHKSSAHRLPCHELLGIRRFRPRSRRACTMT